MTRAKLVCRIYIELLGLRVSAQFPHQLSTLGDQLSFMSPIAAARPALGNERLDRLTAEPLRLPLPPLLTPGK